jgi:hypothetical protein
MKIHEDCVRADKSVSRELENRLFKKIHDETQIFVAKPLYFFLKNNFISSRILNLNSQFFQFRFSGMKIQGL